MRSRGSLFNHSRLESRKTTRPVRFLCSEKNAQRVTLMGDFNQWNAESHPMERQFDGVWRLELELDHGLAHGLADFEIGLGVVVVVKALVRDRGVFGADPEIAGFDRFDVVLEAGVFAGVTIDVELCLGNE